MVSNGERTWLSSARDGQLSAALVPAFPLFLMLDVSLAWCGWADLVESMKLPTGSMAVVELKARYCCDEPEPGITSGRIVCFPAPWGWREEVACSQTCKLTRPWSPVISPCLLVKVPASLAICLTPPGRDNTMVSGWLLKWSALTIGRSCCRSISETRAPQRGNGYVNAGVLSRCISDHMPSVPHTLDQMGG